MANKVPGRVVVVRIFIGITYLAQLIISVPIIVAGVRLSNSCIDFDLAMWIIISGALMAVVGLLGCFGFFTGDDGGVETTYLVLMFLLTYLFTIAAIIAFVFIARHSRPAAPPPNQPPMAAAAAYKEYRLTQFSRFFRKEVNKSTHDWNAVVNCLAPSNGCIYLDHTYNSSQQLFTAKLTPLQSGCCMPPSICGYTFVSPTNWTSPANNQTYNDCYKWSNNPNELCYSCDSCKAGVLANVTKRVHTAYIKMLIALMCSIIVYICQCVYSCKREEDDGSVSTRPFQSQE